eukprot:TRINITY_DN4095_c1_g1_i1.p1 TRINITY_DN4095_c1_g1~~TRINITY_DN4095_c1_g1_i1.p1  ORF type:complete len:243 (+),score=27.70 TRINITY_DN4095_c1_g1_i1:188-916(+)
MPATALVGIFFMVLVHDGSAETIIKGKKLPGCTFEGREYGERIANQFDAEVTSELLQNCNEWMVAINATDSQLEQEFTEEARLQLEVSQLLTLNDCNYFADGTDQPSLGFMSRLGECIPLRCIPQYIRVQSLYGDIVCIPANSTRVQVSIKAPLPEGGDPELNYATYTGFAITFGIVTCILLTVFTFCYCKFVRNQMAREEFNIPERPQSTGHQFEVAQAQNSKVEMVPNRKVETQGENEEV